MMIKILEKFMSQMMFEIYKKRNGNTRTNWHQCNSKLEILNGFYFFEKTSQANEDQGNI